jgi:phage/plasmid-associated DNA primase
VLIDVVNKVIGDHIASINLERLTDQRDAPLINGTLANLCGENADNIVIEDSQVFKSIGSHERWTVHKMHTNDIIEIDTNPLHIFCVNNMPNFKDKSSAIIRRARVVPFKNKFDQDPNFRNSLLHDEQFLSDFLGEMLLYAQKGKKDGWVSPLSKSTLQQIEEYDILRNSAKTFIDEYIELGLVGFKDFNILKMQYENWCKDNSFTQMGVKTFRSSVMKHDFTRKNTTDNKEKVYMLEDYTPGDSRYQVGLYYNTGVKQLELVPEKNEEVQNVMDLFK